MNDTRTPCGSMSYCGQNVVWFVPPSERVSFSCVRVSPRLCYVLCSTNADGGFATASPSASKWPTQACSACPAAAPCAATTFFSAAERGGELGVPPEQLALDVLDALLVPQHGLRALDAQVRRGELHLLLLLALRAGSGTPMDAIFAQAAHPLPAEPVVVLDDTSSRRTRWRTPHSAAAASSGSTNAAITASACARAAPRWPRTAWRRRPPD